MIFCAFLSINTHTPVYVVSETLHRHTVYFLLPFSMFLTDFVYEGTAFIYFIFNSLCWKKILTFKPTAAQHFDLTVPIQLHLTCTLCCLFWCELLEYHTVWMSRTRGKTLLMSVLCEFMLGLAIKHKQDHCVLMFYSVFEFSKGSRNRIQSRFKVLTHLHSR